MARMSLIIAYCIAAIAVISVFYYINVAANLPQPKLSLAFNYTTQIAVGYINNTLPYPIIVNYFYCTTPNKNQFKFSYSGNNLIESGESDPVQISVNANSILPNNCTNWKTSYKELSYSNASNNK
jgi:hypothetical protein